MDIISTTSASATIQLTKDELVLLVNAINESQEALDAWEFPIRMGAQVAEAKQLRMRLRTVLDSMKETGA